MNQISKWTKFVKNPETVKILTGQSSPNYGCQI